MLKPTLALLLACALTLPARAQQPPDARALLQKVTETYRGLNSYRFEGVMSITVGGGGSIPQSFEVPLLVAAERSGRARVDVRNPQMGMTLVSDGKQLVTFLPSLKQYTRKPAEAPLDSAGALRSPPGSPLARYFQMLDGLKSAEIVDDAPVTVGGRTAPCWVVRCDVTPPQALAADSSARAVATFWVDKSRSLVLHDSTTVSMRHPVTGAQMAMDQVTSFSLGEVNGALPDSLFVFAAPAEAQEVQAFSMPGQQQAESELVGQKAPPFTLTDTQGRSVSLAAYKGRVVVLDFWATWCNPCRIEMPRVEKLHQELKNKGLVVMGINVAESPDLVKRFLSRTPYSFRILLDRTGMIGAKYKADAIPTLVVVGKDGLIKSYFRGVTEENRLRQVVSEAMAAAGPSATGARPARRAGSASKSAPTGATKSAAPAPAKAAAPKPKP
jgi:thiol-disulfide isomerase/thioredoxin